jgi:glucose/arabinose dehydrogenase
VLSMPTRALKSAFLLASLLVLPTVAETATVGNALCPGEEVSFNPGNGEHIVVPDGFKVSVFASGLNFPTGIAFRGNSQRFEVYVLESGVFRTSRCNDGVAWQNANPPLPLPPTSASTIRMPSCCARWANRPMRRWCRSRVPA